MTGTVSLVVATQASSRPVDPMPYVWALGLGALMMLRRQAPTLVLAMTAVGFFTYYAAGFPAIGVAVPIAAALYSAAEARHAGAAVVTGAVALLASTGYRLAAGQPVAFVLGYELVSHATLIAAVIALGYSVRTRREVAERGRLLAHLTARERELETEARGREERLKLARDLHDSLGHALSVAVLFTGVAKERYGDALGAGEADAAGGDGRDDPLDRVRAALIDALTDLRSTVTLLRSSNTERRADLTLDDIPSMLHDPALAGVAIDLRMDTDLGAGPEIQQTVFRLVQEAVTNSLKHSDASHIRVDIGSDGDGNIKVSVTDNGSASHQSTAVPQFGNGLTGMQERIRALAGVLEVHAGDGWRVSASIPVGGSR
ncbi:sensor histidine kinase [Kribbella sp. NPDC049174]|uniref:sensor histidine kinase n=1 Tax=Kribbella sp. NPDC049174 TaxID=3364112 RepID=UPI003710C19D